jgi:RNA polymerase sigma factor (TIGR02999 family)
MRNSEALTTLLNAAQGGDAEAARSAYDLVYAELKRRARNSLRSAQPDDTLTPTALVHEVYLRFSERDAAQPLRDRAHFYALAARAMRQILVDHARRRHAGKRGGGARATDLDQALSLHGGDTARTLELDRALRALESRDADLARLVEWHFFAGLNFHEIARETGRHERTVRRDWELARAFLQRELVPAQP